MAVFDNADNKLGKLESQYNGLNRSLQINKKHVDNLTKAYKEEVAANGESSVRAQNLARDINNTVAKQANLERQLKATGAAMKVEKLDLEELNNKMQANGRFTDAVAQKQSLAGNKMGALRTQYAGLGQKITDLTRIREAERQKLETIASVSGKTSSAYTNQKARIAELDNQIKINSNTMDSYAKKIGGLSPQFDGMRNALDNTSARFKEVGDKAWETGKNVTMRFSAPIAVGLGVAIKKAADFEAQMDSVQAVSGATGSEMKQLQDLAVKLGADTKYSAQEAAMGIEELLKAGLSTADVLNGGLAGALDLATAGEIDLASAAEIASTALNAFKDDNLSVADAANILAGGANASATDVEGLRLGLQQVSAVASGAGLSFEDTATALSVFAQNGLKGSDSGTSLKTMLMRLHPQTDAAAAEFERLGLLTTNTENAMKTLKDNGIKPLSGEQDILMEQMHDLAKSMAGPKASTAKVNKEFNKLLMNSGSLQSAFYDSNGDLRSMSEIADILQKSLKGMSSEQRSAALNTMFGSDAIRAGNILYKEGAKGIKDMNKEMSKVTAAEVAKKKMDNLKGAVEELKGSAETLAISAGQTLIPMFTDVVKHAQKMLDKFNDLSPGTQKFITQLAMAGAVAGPAIMTFGGVSRGLGEMMRWTSKTVSGFSLLKLAMQGGSKGAQTLKTSTDLAGAGMSRVAMNSGKAGLSLLGLNPVLLGVGVTLGAGYVAWKLWGEKAYESSKRTQRWGTDVGEAADKSLNKFKNFSDEASNALEVLSVDAQTGASELKNSFEGMSATIKENVNASIKEIKRNWESLPEAAKAATKEETDNIINAYEQQKQEIDGITTSTTNLINNAMKERGKLSTDEQKRVRDASNMFLNAEINSLDISNKKKITLMKALNSDLKGLSKNQALDYSDNVGKAIQNATKSFEKHKKALEENIELGKLQGLDTSEYEIQLETLKSQNSEATLTMATKWYKFQKQAGTNINLIEMALKEWGVSLDDVVSRSMNVTEKATSNSSKMAKGYEGMSLSAQKANDSWNDMLWDEKTGTITTNAKEEVKKASISEKGWNDLTFILHHANLESDAYNTIGDALVENGKWNDLTFEEKQLLTSYPSTALTMSALDDIDEWDKLKPVQQKLITQAKTGKALQQALADVGVWDKLEPEKKVAILTSDAKGAVDNILPALDMWNSLTFEEKKLLVGYEGAIHVSNALQDIGVWDKLEPKEQAMIAKANTNLALRKVLVDMGIWEKLPASMKNLLADNSDVLNKLNSSKGMIVTYNGAKVDLKSLLATNTNLLERVKKGEDVIIDYNGQKINLKHLLGNNKNLLSQIQDGKNVIYSYNGVRVSEKEFLARSNMDAIRVEMRKTIADWDKIPQRDQKVLEFSYRTNGKAPSGPQGFAKGTDFHKGGPALVNDAPGSRFKEMITTPDGNSFIPEGRNVLIPNLPRGSSVLRGDKTAKLIPRYASGTRKQVADKLAKKAEAERKKAAKAQEAARKKAEAVRKKALREAEAARKREAKKPTLAKMSSAFNVSIQPNLSSIQYAGDSTKLNTQLKSLISKLTKESQNRKSKNISTTSVNAAKRFAENEYKKLQTLIKQRDTLIQKIKNGNEKLKELQQQSNDYAKGITDSAKSYTSITSLDKDGFDTKYMQQGMTERLKNLNEFNANLEKLKKMGVNKTTLSDIMEAGVEGGASYAKALAGSDKKTIQSLNSLQSQINTASSRLGNNSANYMYKAGIDSAKGLVKGLESQQKALESASKKMANTIVNTTKKTLKIKSPSQRFRDEVGKMIPSGLITGVESMRSKVAKTMNNLVTVPSIDIPPIREGSLLMTSIKSALGVSGETTAVQTVDNQGVIEQLVASNRQQGEMIQLLKALLSKDLIVDDKALERSNTKIQNRQLRNDLHSLGGSI
ncbi:phage tail tape measure protein [Listeria booriae]|uniref:phage tail tape measure protein n=1 Tax=Listeria booriae TaxID=1552123 RepID=UPI001623A29A|nr:phage tail tape measure protein [Listeria booriae]MBC2369378.1 phage tail tape measure protein [Listeria booriae]